MNARPFPDARRAALAVRRNPVLVAYWRAGSLVLCNYVTGETMAARARDLAILERAAEWMPLTALEAQVSASGDPAERVEQLRQFGALEDLDRALEPAEQAAADWHNWGPAATWFHQGSKNVRFVGPESADEVARRLFNPLASPPSYDAKGTGSPILLGEFRENAATTSGLLGRRTWRRYGPGPLRFADLSALLGLTWGVQQWMRVSPEHRLPLKTSPSGGSCHSIDCYVLALEVEGIAAGLYHYDPDAHAMALVRPASRADAHRYLQSQPAFAEGAAIFFMVAVFSRVQWKYQTSRAYRVVLLEAGHLGQTFCVSASALGLAPFSTGAFADAEIESDLGLDGLTESVVYATGVGTRPGHEPWAPFADGTAPLTDLPAWASRLQKEPR